MSSSSKSSSTSSSSSSSSRMGMGEQSYGDKYSHAEEERWRVIYPVYFNRAKKINQGRKVPLKYAVEYPTAQDIFEVCRSLQLPCKPELNKMYCRDYLTRGRIRVMMRDETGKPLLPEVTNRQLLLNLIGQHIAELPSRAKRIEEEKREEESFKNMFLSWADTQKKAEKAEVAAAATAGLSGNAAAVAAAAALKKEKKKAKK